MRKLIILLIFVLAAGAGSIYMLNNHADMQTALPQTYDTTDDDNISEEEPVEVQPAGLSVTFSQKKTFYDHNIEVELSCPDENAVIYYTLNGNDPDISAKRYTSPITISAKNKVNATTIKAIAVNGEEQSETALKSYVVGRNVFERFTEDTLVFVLSSDEYNLYDYYNGIAVEGYLRDKYKQEEYTGGEINPTAPANYNIRGRESERDMYVEVYNSDGEQLISQAAGARVVGGYSRANDQKSFRLIARNSYSEGNGKFKYPFFRNARDAYGGLLTKFDRITLRDGANDREFAGLRDELSMTLAFDAGFNDAQNVRPAAVFLNSEYYGYSWLHEAYCAGNLESKYGGNKENFRIVGAKELEIESDDPEDEQAVADFNKLVALAEKDLTFDLYFNEFCSLVDIDDLMMYYAMQIYIDNKDWPGNNFKAWRYYPSEGEEITSEYLDGRWRFLLFDAEYAWGLYGAGYSDNTLKAVLTGKHMKGSSHILRGLLVREDMREKFAATMCELYCGAFSPDHVLETLDKLIEDSDPEQMYALENGYVSNWANEWTFKDSREQIRDFAKYRPVIVKKNIMSQFGYSGDLYNVSFRNPNGAKTVIGSRTMTAPESFSTDYFTEVGTDIEALPYDGFAFDHWEINGIEYKETRVRIDSSMADENSRIVIELYLTRTEKTAGRVCVSEIYTSGDGDWIEIYNPTSETVNIRGYHLSDKASQLDKYTIPSIDIPSGEVVMIVTKNNSETSALMKHQANFNLKTGETLYFTDPEMNIISQIPVLELDEGISLAIGIDGLYHEDSVTEGIYLE